MEKEKQTVSLSKIAGILHGMIGLQITSWSLKGDMLLLTVASGSDSSKTYEILAMASWGIRSSKIDCGPEDLVTEYFLETNKPGKIKDVSIHKETLDAYINTEAGLISIWPKKTEQGTIWLGVKDLDGNFYTMDETDASKALVIKTN